MDDRKTVQPLSDDEAAAIFGGVPPDRPPQPRPEGDVEEEIFKDLNSN